MSQNSRGWTEWLFVAFGGANSLWWAGQLWLSGDGSSSSEDVWRWVGLLAGMLMLCWALGSLRRSW